MNFTVVSYYTVNTPYEKEVQNLIASLDRFQIPHDIRGIESKGGWQSNTMFKAQFLKQMLDEVPGAIVWMDADATVEKSPDFLNYVDVDAAFYFRTNGGRVGRIPEPFELLSGTMYFANNSIVRGLFDLWIEENNKDQRDLEQHNLQKVVPRWRAAGGRMGLIPQTYCRIFDAKWDDSVIVHHQASRRFRSA